MTESICAKMKLKFILGAEEANLGSNDENVSFVIQMTPLSPNLLFKHSFNCFP